MRMPITNVICQARKDFIWTPTVKEVQKTAEEQFKKARSLTPQALSVKCFQRRNRAHAACIEGSRFFLLRS
jgi:hypothetical protein